MRRQGSYPPLEALLSLFRRLLEKLFELSAGNLIVCIEVKVRNEAVILIFEEVDSLLLECNFYLLSDLFSRNILVIAEDFNIGVGIFVELIEYLLCLEELILIL